MTPTPSKLRKLPRWFLALALALFSPASCHYEWNVPDTGDAAEPTCRLASDCPSTSFCQFPDFRCGKGAPGRCVAHTGSSPVCADAVATQTSSDPELACACDGNIYVTRTAANVCGKGLAVRSEFCPSPPPFVSAHFDCGYALCRIPDNVAKESVCVVESGRRDFGCNLACNDCATCFGTTCTTKCATEKGPPKIVTCE